jgi:metallopeptidase YgjP-like protein/HsdM-like protein
MAIKKSELYSSLWISCDELRGGMDASQYKDYVLILLLIKYVSDKYARDPNALIDVPTGWNPAARRVWLNLELAKKLMQCLEYVVVHELVHLLERNHTERFTALMESFIPHWRQYRAVLNRTPLGHEEWDF